MNELEEAINAVQNAIKRAESADASGAILQKADLTNILSLLKAQQPKKVKNVVGTAVSAIGECPSCGMGLNTSFLAGQRKTQFCDICGQAVKWE